MTDLPPAATTTAADIPAAAVVAAANAIRQLPYTSNRVTVAEAALAAALPHLTPPPPEPPLEACPPTGKYCDACGTHWGCDADGVAWS